MESLVSWNVLEERRKKKKGVVEEELEGRKAGKRSGGFCLQEERGNRVWCYLECVWWGGGRVVDGARIV